MPLGSAAALLKVLPLPSMYAAKICGCVLPMSELSSKRPLPTTT